MSYHPQVFSKVLGNFQAHSKHFTLAISRTSPTTVQCLDFFCHPWLEKHQAIV